MWNEVLANVKQAATNAVIKEAQTRYGKNPKFPQTPEEVNALFAGLDALIPQEAQTSGVGKQMYFYLLKQLFGVEPPGFIIGEDDYRVKPLMKSYYSAVQKNKLRGNDANFDNYRSMEDLEAKLEEVLQVKPKPKTLGEGEVREVFNEKEWGAINKGAVVVYNQAGWKMWKVPKSSDAKNMEAARLLCDNPRHGVKWCVGRGSASSYIPNGDFYVIAFEDNSKYAISSHSGRDLTIWNAADTPIFQTASSSYRSNNEEISDTPPSIRAAEKKAGVKLPDGGIPSAIPAEIVPILQAVRPKESTIQMIPEGQLKPMDPAAQSVLYKVMHYVEPEPFVQDVNSMYSSVQKYVIAHAYMSAAVSRKVKMHFSHNAFAAMNKYTMLGYIEALAGAGETSLPSELDDVLITEFDKWTKN